VTSRSSLAAALWGRRTALPRYAAYGAVIVLSGALYGLATRAIGHTGTGSLIAGSRYFFATSFVFAVVAGLPLQAIVQRRIDALLPVDRSQSGRAVATLLRDMEASPEPAQLIDRAVRAVADEFLCAHVVLLRIAPDERGLIPDETSGIGAALPHVSIEHALVRVISTLHSEMTRMILSQPRYANVRADCVEVLDQLRADVIFPIEYGDTLVGLLALGWGGAERELAESELQVVRAVAAGIGLSMMRARDVERLRSSKIEMERLAQFLPRATAEAVLRDELPGDSGRRRRLTVVSCDLSSLTGRDAALPPDVITNVLSNYYTIVADESAAEGGTVARVRGARAVVVFGDPESVDDDQRRGLAFAARLQRRMAEIAPLTGEREHVSIGIESGFATVGFIRVGSRLEYEVIGRVMQRSAQFVTMAGPGETLIGPATRELLGGEVACEEVKLVDEVSGNQFLGHRVLEFRGERILSDDAITRLRRHSETRVSRAHASLLDTTRRAAPSPISTQIQVFISYAREDQEFVLGLATALRERGVKMWVDQWEIQSGANWDASIDQALSASGAFLIVLSPAAVDSPEVQGELRVALEEGKVIVSVLRRPCRVPRRLRLLQYIDATSQAEQDAVIDSIVATLDRAANDA